MWSVWGKSRFKKVKLFTKNKYKKAVKMLR